MHQPANQAFESLLPKQMSVLRAFGEQGVEFTIVGGYAMRCIGHLRLTHDLDIVIKQSNENAARIRRSFEKLPHGGTAALEEFLLLPQKKLAWYSVELFSTMRGFLYAEIEKESLLHQVQELHVRTMSLAHMKRAKKLALSAPDRHEKKAIDKTDLAFLRAKKRGLRFPSSEHAEVIPLVSDVL